MHPASERLQRLSAYLQQDPTNAELLAEAFEAALACGDHGQADVLLAQAECLQPEGAAWRLRRAHLCIARRQLVEACALLRELRRASEHPVVLHDLAHVHLLQGDAQAAHALLQDEAHEHFRSAGAAQDALQVAWLRACHHLGLLDEAWAWIARARSVQALQPAACGVASLIALDQGEEEAARTLAEIALAMDPGQAEALVAGGCMALAAGEPERATVQLQRAVERNPEDGRTWSALGMASLLGRRLAQAREQLARAVAILPTHAPSWQALGWTLLLLREPQAAIEALRRALQLDEAAADSHAALGLALALAGDAVDAEACVQRAEHLDARDEVAALARACLREGGRSDALQAVLQRLPAQWRPRP